MKVWKGFFLGATMIASIIGFVNCEKKNEMVQAPATEDVVVAITPSSQQIKGELFTLELSDLKVIKTVDKKTKELAGTPTLKGNFKIINHSKSILDVQGATIQYLDGSGNPIAFKSGEKRVTYSPYWTDLQPGKEAENYLDVTVPMSVIKDKSLGSIQVSVVYIPTPLKREVLQAPVTMEQK